MELRQEREWTMSVDRKQIKLLESPQCTRWAKRWITAGVWNYFYPLSTAWNEIHAGELKISDYFNKQTKFNKIHECTFHIAFNCQCASIRLHSDYWVQHELSLLAAPLQTKENASIVYHHPSSCPPPSTMPLSRPSLCDPPLWPMSCFIIRPKTKTPTPSDRPEKNTI